MAEYQIGDIVVLSAGSMRMAVEAVKDDRIHTVWCHEGTIGRDAFPAALLRKWEPREDDKSRDSGPRGKPAPRGDRDRGGSDRGGSDRGGPPRQKTGWDGKPREKKYFRKD